MVGSEITRRSKMKKWIVLGVVWIMFIGFNIALCFAEQEICVKIPDDLYKALATTVDNTNNEGIANDKDYMLQTVPGYLEKNVHIWVKSYKDDLERKAINTTELKQMALGFQSLSPEKQKELKKILASAVEANK
mgnify:CR=1 FL=1